MPTFALSLRREVEEVTETYGWTYEALTKMHKIDSFLMESQRLSPLGACTFYVHSTTPPKVSFIFQC